jgi:hypothetical protein
MHAHINTSIHTYTSDTISPTARSQSATGLCFSYMCVCVCVCADTHIEIAPTCSPAARSQSPTGLCCSNGNVCWCACTLCMCLLFSVPLPQRSVWPRYLCPRPRAPRAHPSVCLNQSARMGRPHSTDCLSEAVLVYVCECEHVCIYVCIYAFRCLYMYIKATKHWLLTRRRFWCMYKQVSICVFMCVNATEGWTTC